MEEIDTRERHLRLIAQDMTQVPGRAIPLILRVACCWQGEDVMVADMARASEPLPRIVAVVTDGVEHDLVDVAGNQLSGIIGINTINHTDKGALTNQQDPQFASILSGEVMSEGYVAPEAASTGVGHGAGEDPSTIDGMAKS